MEAYEWWKREFLNYIDYIGLNYGVLGDCVTCIDENGHKLGSIDLKEAWEKDMLCIEMILVLEGRR